MDNLTTLFLDKPTQFKYLHQYLIIASNESVVGENKSLWKNGPKAQTC